jgi:hypothetical protein
MTRGFVEEFATVDILLDSATRTGRTDAFIISFTKLEKQVRHIFTFLIYQFPEFDLSDYDNILVLIASKWESTQYTPNHLKLLLAMHVIANFEDRFNTPQHQSELKKTVA